MLPGVSLEWMCFPETIKIFQQFNNSDYAEVFSKKYTQQCTRILKENIFDAIHTCDGVSASSYDS